MFRGDHQAREQIAMPAETKRVALYLRVSTAEQTVENQRRELLAIAERHGWQIVAEFVDAGSKRH